MTTIPSGPYTAEQRARMLNIPIHQVRTATVVTPFGYGGQSVRFVAQGGDDK